MKFSKFRKHLFAQSELQIESMAIVVSKKKKKKKNQGIFFNVLHFKMSEDAAEITFYAIAFALHYSLVEYRKCSPPMCP